jgi:hypothetical protein
VLSPLQSRHSYPWPPLGCFHAAPERCRSFTNWSFPNVDCVVIKVLQCVPETPRVPGGVTLCSKKLGPRVVVHPVHLPLVFRKKGNYFAPDQTTRAGGPEFFFTVVKSAKVHARSNRSCVQNPYLVVIQFSVKPNTNSSLHLVRFSLRPLCPREYRLFSIVN